MHLIFNNIEFVVKYTTSTFNNNKKKKKMIEAKQHSEKRQFGENIFLPANIINTELT